MTEARTTRSTLEVAGDAAGTARVTRSTLEVLADPSTFVPPPPLGEATTGWPNRAGRISFGPQMRDERPTVNPRQELNGDKMNLAFWQVGALGLLAPKISIIFEPGSPDMIRRGAFAWDQTLYRDIGVADYPSYLTVVKEGVGDWCFQFQETVLGRPDADGVPQGQSLSFSSGFVAAFQYGAYVSQVMGMFELLDIQDLLVQTTDHSGTLIDRPFILMAW